MSIIYAVVFPPRGTKINGLCKPFKDGARDGFRPASRIYHYESLTFMHDGTMAIPLRRDSPIRIRSTFL